VLPFKRVFKLPRAAIYAILVISALRVVIAMRFPLTADETYYWVWSKHLAYGYTDHPPAVAWLIALTSVFGNGALAVRLPFILCEATAAFAVGRAAMILSNDARAGTAATIAFLMIPQGRLAIGEALPDGPYLACWGLALWFAARAQRKPSPGTMVPLGLALGGALLSRFFGWALLAGIVAFALAPKERHLWKNGLWLALLIAGALYAPFIFWNASHSWANFAFTFANRQPLRGFSPQRVEVVTSLRFVVFAIVLWIVGIFTTIRPRYNLLAWTALPFPALLAVLAFFEPVESYWILGPLASLCAGIGIAYARQRPARKRLWFAAGLIPAAYAIASAVFVALPEGTQASLLRATGGTLKGPFYSQAFAFGPLSRDLRRLLGQPGAAALSDRLEIASELTYNGVGALIVGGAPQVGQWRAWHPSAVPPRTLLVSFGPLTQDRELFARITRAFGHVGAGPTLRYTFAATEAATFYTTWCERPNDAAARTLFGN